MKEEISPDVSSMFETIMSKLGKLDIIDSHMQSVEHELKEISRVRTRRSRRPKERQRKAEENRRRNTKEAPEFRRTKHYFKQSRH
jgi:hypothetical protein